MADYDSYPAVLDDEEEARKQPYPAVRPVALANTTVPALPPDIARDNGSSIPAVAHAEPTMSGATAPPRPDWKDYEPAAKHGWGKLGEIAASFNPVTNEVFNRRPQVRAKQEYEAATKDYDTNFSDQMKIAAEDRAKASEESQSKLREAQGRFFDERLPAQAEIEKSKEAAAQRKTETQGDTARDVASMRQQNQRAQIKVMGDGTYEELERGKWTRIGAAPPRTEPGNYLPVNDENGATTGWIDPKSHRFVGVAEITPDSAAPGGVIPPKPSGQTRSRQDQAAAIDRASDGLIKTIEAHKNKIGNVKAILESAFLETPIADPELSGIATELASYAALQPALHGFRGQDALREFMKIIGGVPKDADALIASIQAIKKTAGYVNPRIKQMPKVGDIIKGHKFKGGDPAKQENWEKQ